MKNRLQITGTEVKDRVVSIMNDAKMQYLNIIEYYEISMMVNAAAYKYLKFRYDGREGLLFQPVDSDNMWFMIRESKSSYGKMTLAAPPPPNVKAHKNERYVI